MNLFKVDSVVKNIFSIYGKDMKNIATNWVVAVLIGGLVILPSLYAWFNIKASWDPYGQTDQIPIGIVNEDEGAEVRGEDIDVGEMLVESLEENDSMNWQFVSKDKAMDEVKNGNYYAVIVIPSDFSEQLGSVLSDKPEKADMEYYVNQKINAIAPKITDKGATVIVEEISSEFISTVNGVIFDMFNEIGLELEEEQPDIEKFQDYIFTLEEELPGIHDTLTETDDDAKEAKDIVQKALGKIPEVKEMTDDGAEQLDSAMGRINQAEELLDELGPKISNDLAEAQSIVHEVNEAIDSATENIGVEEDLDEKIDKQVEKLNTSIEKIEGVIENIKELEDNLDEEDEHYNEKKEQLETARENLEELLSRQNDMKEHLENLRGAGEEADKVFNRIAEKANASTEKLDQFIEDYNNEIKPAINSAIDDMKDKLTSAKSMVNEIQETIPKVEELLNSTDGHLDEGQEVLNKVLEEYPFVQDKVSETADKLRELKGEADLSDIIELLKNDPDAERGFFAEPVKLHENDLFPIENYGTVMTPFYTVLSIWVGALLLISLLSTELPGEIKPTIMYFGRLLTFLTIGLLQTLIVTSGDMFLIGVSVAHPVWFIVFGLLISCVFMTIVYSVVSIFGDVGKALAIIMLVLQIAGSGGTYPVVLLPSFFQKINPFLPFTYAVDLMREAVGGIVWHQVYISVSALVIFGMIFVLLAVFLKGPNNRLMNKLLASKDSRLFH